MHVMPCRSACPLSRHSPWHAALGDTPNSPWWFLQENFIFPSKPGLYFSNVFCLPPKYISKFPFSLLPTAAYSRPHTAYANIVQHDINLLGPDFPHSAIMEGDGDNGHFSSPIPSSCLVKVQVITVITCLSKLELPVCSFLQTHVSAIVHFQRSCCIFVVTSFTL